MTTRRPTSALKQRRTFVPPLRRWRERRSCPKLCGDHPPHPSTSGPAAIRQNERGRVQHQGHPWRARSALRNRESANKPRGATMPSSTSSLSGRFLLGRPLPGWLLLGRLLDCLSGRLLFGRFFLRGPGRDLLFLGFLDRPRVAVSRVFRRDQQPPCRRSRQEQRVPGDMLVMLLGFLVLRLGGHSHQPAVPLLGGIRQRLDLLLCNRSNDNVQIRASHFPMSLDQQPRESPL